MIKSISILAIIIYTFGINGKNLNSTSTLECCTEKDCAIGEDYIDIDERMMRVLDTNPYSSNIQDYSNFRTSFFDNLTYDFGMNYKGSCGYVAIGMLLSYYDTFISDSIIPEQYDVNSIGEETNMVLRRNSPGIMKDSIVDPSDTSDASYGYYLSASGYYSSISSLSNSSLHAKLISIGANNGFYDFDDDDSPCGTNFYIRYIVMQQYFDNVLGYTYGNQYSFDFFNGESSESLSASVRNFAIQQVLSGNPVLLSVGGSGGGHVVVAYDYDSNLDKLYCHMGWSASSTHKTIENYSFTRYKTALAINLNLSHNHSNNYGVITINNNIPTTNYYCFHDHHIFTYTGGSPHSFNDHYVYYTSNTHKAYCLCGDYILKVHAIDSSHIYFFHGHQYAPCIDCGAIIDLGGSGPIIPVPNSYYHPATDNGSYIMPNGIYVIVEEDLEAYLNGTLVFHPFGGEIE